MFPLALLQYGKAGTTLCSPLTLGLHLSCKEKGMALQTFVCEWRNAEAAAWKSVVLL